MKKLTILFLLQGLFLTALPGQDTIYEKKQYQVVQVANGPDIDGFLNDESWNSTEWAGDFYMHSPYDDRPATQNTRFKIIFDRDFLYVGIRAFDTAPDSIISRLTNRDDLDGDFVGIQLDSYNDKQTAFSFFSSVAGSRLDFYASQDGSDEDETWDAVWWCKTRVDDLGYTVEMKIPFNQLRYDKNSQGTWGVQVFREIYRKDEICTWQPISREAPGWIHLFGELNGMTGIQSKKQLQLIPYTVAGIELYEKESDNPYRSSGRQPILNAGLDAKIGISNNFTLDVTINPDFGQVEADPSRVNLTAFETYFKERRPFFIEGKNIFEFPLNDFGRQDLFYSRRIGRPPHHYPDLNDGEYARVPSFTNILGAVKISGKTKNGLSIGILESLTAGEKAMISDGSNERSELVEPMTSYFTGSINKEFNKGNTIVGGVITSTNRLNSEEHLDYLHSSAVTGGLNFEQHFNDRKWGISGRVYGSSVHGSEEALLRTQTSPVRFFQRPDAAYVDVDSSLTSLQGYGGRLAIFKHSGKFVFGSFATMNSPGFEINDMGFLSSTDEIMQITYANYNFNEPFGVFRSMHLHIDQFNLFDFGGTHQMSGVSSGGFAEFRNFWGMGIFFGLHSEKILNSVLRGGPSMALPGDISAGIEMESNSRKKFSIETGFEYDRGRENSSESFEVALEMNYKPISNLELSLEPEYMNSRRVLQYITQLETGSEERYVFGSIDQNILSMSLRVNLILTPEMSLQFWGQPFLASGDYSEFKHVTDPLNNKFSDRYHVYSNGEISQAPDGSYLVQESGGASYGFDNPDFQVQEFLSNLVFRWEYRPASYIYLVWSQSRSGYSPGGLFQPGADFQELWKIYPGQTFLIKLSYRIGR